MNSLGDNNHNHNHNHNHNKMRNFQGEELRIVRMMFMWRTNGLMRKKENIRKKQ